MQIAAAIMQIAAVVAVQAAGNASSMFDTIFPSTRPTVTTEPWQCATESVSQYFRPPMPTGTLQSALDSYGEELWKACTFTGIEYLECPSPDQSRWCAFTTAAPESVLADYSAYGSEVESWWAERSESVFTLASMCPIRWYNAMHGTPGGKWALNDTIAHAGCYAEAHPTGDNAASTTGANAASRRRVLAGGPEPTGVPGRIFG